MKPTIILPLPFDDWATFEPFVKRFVETFKQFPPSCPYQIHAVGCWGRPTDRVREMFYGTKTEFYFYANDGADIGSAQQATRFLDDDTFMVMMTSRCYFHRAGWLERLVEARKQHGPGLYGCSANHEGYRLHLCTRAYAMDAGDFKDYPIKIDSRLKGPMFEIGENNPHGNLMEWMESKDRPSRLVFFDGVREKPDWFTAPNRFRHGDQSNMLVLDKHTDLWRDANDEQKLALQLSNSPQP